MTDRELQDLLDRLAREGGEPADAPEPDVEDHADWKAYQVLYAALEEEPDGTLPPDFAEQVADRVMPATAPATAKEQFPWLEWILPPLALVAAFVATLLLMPALSPMGAAAVQQIVEPFSTLQTTLRLDIAFTAGAALLVIGLLDRFVLQARFRQDVATA